MADDDNFNEEQLVMDMGGGFRRGDSATLAMTAADREIAMRKAIDISARSLTDLGMEAPDEKTLNNARVKAEKLLAGEGAEGIADMRNLMLSTGLPAARAIFHQMIAAARMKGSARVKAETAIANFSPITEKGCVQFDFRDRTTGQPNTAYILLDECESNYDYGAALRQFLARLPEDKSQEVLGRSSMLFNSGRTLYAQLASTHLSLIRKINRLPSGDPCTKFLTLQVDMGSTTLYIDAAWPKRIGLLIHYKADVEAANAADALAAAAAAAAAASASAMTGAPRTEVATAMGGTTLAITGVATIVGTPTGAAVVGTAT
jgi:hypothetical protein